MLRVRRCARPEEDDGDAAAAEGTCCELCIINRVVVSEAWKRESGTWLLTLVPLERVPLNFQDFFVPNVGACSVRVVSNGGSFSARSYLHIHASVALVWVYVESTA